MNYRLLMFAGTVTMVVGMGLGLILATLLPTPFQGGIYRDQKPGFMIVGGAGGFLVGMGMEAIRELKQKQDQAEQDSRVDE